MAHQRTQEKELNMRRAAARDAAHAFIGSIEAFMSEGQGAALTEKPAQHQRRVWLRWPDFWASAKRPNSKIDALRQDIDLAECPSDPYLPPDYSISRALLGSRRIRRNEFKF